MIKQSQRKRPRLRVEDHKNLSDPKPSSKRKVIELSQSIEYDIAKTEWVLQNVITTDSDDYSNICDLCGNASLKYNFILNNPFTGHTISIGSTCIIRFGLVAGNIDVDSGVAILNNFLDEKYLLDQIRGLTRTVMTFRPEYELLGSFIKFSKQYMDLKGIKEPTIEQLGQMAFGELWDEKSKSVFEPNRLYAIWYTPSIIEPVKTQKLRKERQIKEGTTWGHKRRKGAFITDTFGRSEDYNVERSVTDKLSKKGR